MKELPTAFQQYIHLSKYARFNDDLGRRETWEETVDRYINFFTNHLRERYNYHVLEHERKLVRDAILNLEVMPSMRAMMTAGEALARDNAAGYNCSALAIDAVYKFSEVMYLLTCGCGVGFSVERKHINNLPSVPPKLYDTDTTLVVRDSRIGWCTAYKELLGLLYSGQVPKWDLSQVRPAGARLKTFGGRASGPEPLDRLFKFAVSLFRTAAGRRLTSLEVHDLVCKTGEVVVSGGVRRSALISLSEPSDEGVRDAKSGEWWRDNPQRALANNSLVYDEPPTGDEFLEEWSALHESRSGERGIFSRYAARDFLHQLGRRDPEHEWLINPCSEILLRDSQLCNLSEVIVRADDTYNSLVRKVRIAAILGTWQSTLTDFRFLSERWAENCTEERLLGVSLTGIMDHKIFATGDGEWSNFYNGVDAGRTLSQLLESLKQEVIRVNKRISNVLDINPSTATTCIKPSGTVSQLANCSSGIHPRYSRYYIRRVRQDVKDPLSDLLIAEGVPYEEDVISKGQYVFSFPVAAPKDALTVDDFTAVGQLEHWAEYAKHYTEHKPSVSVYLKEHEWLKVGVWVYRHLDIMSGVSFFPVSEHTYAQAPYEAIDESTYRKLASQTPERINWARLVDYESVDNTSVRHELACQGGACEL